MDASPLNKLPAELRNNIYELALHVPNGIDIDVKSANKITTAQASQQPLALTQTCKQIRLESLPMFYATNVFSFATSGMWDIIDPYEEKRTHSFTSVKKWVHERGELRAAVAEIEIRLGQWSSSKDDVGLGTLEEMIKDYQRVFTPHPLRLTVEIETWCMVKWDHVVVKLPMHDLRQARRNLDSLTGGAGAEGSRPWCSWAKSHLKELVTRLRASTAGEVDI